MSVPSVVLLPYLAVFYPYLALRRARADLGAGRGAWRSWITPSLQIGGFLYRSDVSTLAREGVSAIVNVSRELWEPRDTIEEAGLSYHQVPCWDARVPALDDARAGVLFIADQIERGRKVYVHCASGVGRSVSLALCYLCEQEGRPVEEALTSITKTRPRVSLSEVQRAFVDEYLAAFPPPAAC